MTPEHDGCCQEYIVNEPAPKCHDCPRLVSSAVERARRASEIVRRKPEPMGK